MGIWEVRNGCSAFLGSQSAKGVSYWAGERCSADLRGFPPETKPDYVEPLWLVGYA
ncbi:MAG: hypothetical protein F6J99_41960 [Moorea sp. SIO4G3]|nr:hypothetical protein [Moorena sp. SIO4G3]